MIEKLKSAAIGIHRSTDQIESKQKKSRSKSRLRPQPSPYSNHNEGYDSEPPPYDSIGVDEQYTEPDMSGRRGPLPRRDQAGFTITQESIL
jgi:hypothetical protein